MTTTTAIPSSHTSRGWLPALSLVVAGGAVALGVVAIATDDTGQQAPIVVERPAPAAIDVAPAVAKVGASAVACTGQAQLEAHCFE